VKGSTTRFIEQVNNRLRQTASRKLNSEKALMQTNIKLLNQAFQVQKKQRKPLKSGAGSVVSKQMSKAMANPVDKALSMFDNRPLDLDNKMAIPKFVDGRLLLALTHRQQQVQIGVARAEGEIEEAEPLQVHRLPGDSPYHYS